MRDRKLNPWLNNMDSTHANNKVILHGKNKVRAQMAKPNKKLAEALKALKHTTK